MNRSRTLVLSISLICFAGTIVLAITHESDFTNVARRIPFLRRFFKITLDQAVSSYGAAARTRLKKSFGEADVLYPPDQVVYIALKKERSFFVYASAADKKFKYICTYPIFGASGVLGPKLREGDYQVPEGLYQLALEPDTPYHVALRLNYPNASDLARAKADNRENPGSDILVHGTRGSIGCIAVGNPASEDLFILAYDTRDKHLPLIIAPNDLRVSSGPPKKESDPVWLQDLYAEISAELAKYPQPQTHQEP